MKLVLWLALASISTGCMTIPPPTQAQQDAVITGLCELTGVAHIPGIANVIKTIKP